MNSEAKLDLLIKTMQDVEARMLENTQKLNTIETGIGDEVRLLRQALEEKERKWEQERKNLTEAQKQLEQRIDQLERGQRRNNAIVTCSEFTTENGKAIVSKLLTQIDGTCRPTEISCWKAAQGAAKVLVRFNSLEDKMKVFKMKRSLKHTGADGANHPVFINDDCTRKDQEVNYHIRKMANEMRNQKKDVKLGYRKLCVNGEWFVWDDEEKKLTSRKN